MEEKNNKDLSNSLKDLEKNLSAFTKYVEPMVNKDSSDNNIAYVEELSIEKKISIGYYIGIAILLLLSIFGFIDFFAQSKNEFILTLMPYWAIVMVISGIKSIINMFRK